MKREREKENGNQCCYIVLHLLKVCFNKFLDDIFIHEVVYMLFLDKMDAFDLAFCFIFVHQVTDISLP